MFTSFFYTLRERKVPVSITEWMTLMEALAKGYISSLNDFYYLARAILVKSEAYFDHYDVAFQEHFKGIKGPPQISEEILNWLKDPINRLLLTDEERALLESMELDQLLEELEKRLRELPVRADAVEDEERRAGLVASLDGDHELLFADRHHPRLDVARSAGSSVYPGGGPIAQRRSYPAKA